MKLLFVGDGKHDVGNPGFGLQPRPVGGVVFTLARRICSRIAEDSTAMYWRELSVLPQGKKAKGWADRVESAIVLSHQFGCQGTICVIDRDGKPERQQHLEDGRQRGLEVVGTGHLVVCGIAVQSIESWTLGDPDALASVLDLEVKALQEFYKVGDVESFYNLSGKPEHRPKDILKRIAERANQTDTTELRGRIAEAADLRPGTNLFTGFQAICRPIACRPWHLTPSDRR